MCKMPCLQWDMKEHCKEFIKKKKFKILTKTSVERKPHFQLYWKRRKKSGLLTCSVMFFFSVFLFFFAELTGFEVAGDKSCMLFTVLFFSSCNQWVNCLTTVSSQVERHAGDWSQAAENHNNIGVLRAFQVVVQVVNQQWILLRCTKYDPRDI